MILRFAALFLIPALGLLTGCDASGTTSGSRFELHPRMESEGRTATTRSGWSVELKKGQIALGALHFFSGEPLGASNRLLHRPSSVLALWDRAEGLFGVRAAHAHPGHYVEGDALAELLTPVTVDLLAGSTPLGVADATSGTYRSGRITFATPPIGALATEMGEASLILEGTARKDTEQRSFRFRAAGATLNNASQKPEIEGCRFAEAQIDAMGAVVVTAHPAIWFAAADFTELAPSPDGTAVDIPNDSRLYRQLEEQILAAAGISFRYAAE